MDYMEFVWLGVTIAAAVVEAIVPALVSIWFVPGGLAALIVSLCGGELWLQIVVFLAVSALALAVTRPLAKQAAGKGPTPTNADMALGKEAVVTEEINDLLGAGRVSLLGNSWAARSDDGNNIPKGETVLVERIEGVKLVVSPKKRP